MADYVLHWFICVVLLFLVFGFFFPRVYTAMLIGELLSPSNRKKRKKGQTFSDWFFLKRYNDVLPSWMKFYNFGEMLFFLAFMITGIVAAIIHLERDFFAILLIICLCVVIAPFMIVYFLCRTPSRKQKDGFDIGRITNKQNKRN